MMLHLTYMSWRLELAIEAMTASVLIRFLILSSTVGEPLSGEYERLRQPERWSHSATSSSIASERVPLGSCQVNVMPRCSIFLQKSTIHDFLTIAVRS